MPKLKASDVFWAASEPHLRTALANLHSAATEQQISLGDGLLAKLGPAGRDSAPEKYAVNRGVAVIDIAGVLTKHPTIWQMIFGGATMQDMAAQIQAATKDRKVKSILLRIDSPGGTVAGVSDLADAIYKARQSKRVVAYISDLGASGAYCAASQADAIYADVDAMVGSIGVYLVVDDLSKMAEDRGIKVHVIKAGEHKGDGVAGAEVTSSQIKEFQRTVDQLAETFVDAVARGRGWDRQRVEKLADGRVHVGVHAQQLGLVDGIRSLDEVVAEMQNGTGGTARAQARRVPLSQRSLGAANGVAAGIHEGARLMNKMQRQYLESLGLDPNSTDEEAQEQVAALSEAEKAMFDALADAKTAAPAPAPEPEPVVEDNAADDGAIARLAVAEERKRVAHIRNTAARCGFDADWVAKMTDGGHTAEAVNGAALEKLAAAEKPVSLGGESVEAGADRNRESLGPAIVDAVAIRMGARLVDTERDPQLGLRLGKEREAHGRAKEFAGKPLFQMAEMYLRACGVDVSGLSRAQIAERAFVNCPRVPLAAGVHSTSDFPYLLAAASGKQMATRYAEIPPQWPKFCKRVTAPDFKEQKLLSLSEMPNLATVTEGSEYTYGTLSENQETWTLAKKGVIFALTWETIVNDDLGAFNDLIAAQGAAGRRAEDIVAFAILTANAALADSVALFHAATHGNDAASGGAPTITTLNAGRAAMAIQQGLGSAAYVLSRPATIITPEALWGTTQTLLNSEVNPADSRGHEKNIWQGRLEHVSHPLLDADDTGQWYLAADPLQVPTIVVGFLEGMNGPELSQEGGFDTDTRKFKVKHVVAAKAADYRGLYRNSGA